MKPRLQNKVAGSELTLPFCAFVAVILWWLPECAFSVRNLLGLVVCVLTTYVVMETNTRHHIIRIRTRMMSCVWLVFAAILPFMHPLGEPIIAAGLLCVSYYLLFRCYQKHRPQLNVFHAFLMLGIGGFFAPIMLLMAIPYYIYLIVFLRSLTRKAFWAGIIGLTVPYWCYGVWKIIIQKSSLELWTTDGGQWFDVSPLQLLTIQLSDCDIVKLSTFAFIALLGIVSIIHYLRTNYDDKIRVRMILYIYMSQTLLLMAYMLLLPSHYETTLALLVASASPLIAHYFALSKGILNTIFFVLSVLLTVCVAVLNLIIPNLLS
jgi:hypothetical protein